MIQNYNDNAAALKWEIINDQKDIGKWELTTEDKVIEGQGFKDFLSAAEKLVDKKQVIFVKSLNWFVLLASHFVSFKDKKFFANQDMVFYHIELTDKIELRNWDNFWKKIDNGQDFLKRLDTCREYFKGECKNKLSFDNHFKFTLARDMWEDIKYKYYLKSSWSSNYVEMLLPQDEDEWEEMKQLDKGSFYFCNSDYFNKIVPQVYCYDISSSHISLLLRKKYPSSSFTRAVTIEEALEVIKRKFHCWHGTFWFKKLQYKVDFPIDLTRFGFRDEEGMCNWYLTLTNVDMEWFKKVFSWEGCACLDLYYAEQKELPKNYARMLEDLYLYKNTQQKGTFAKEIYKFRAELPFGQPIKSVEYSGKVIYNEDCNSFEVIDEEDKTLKEVQQKLRKRGMPMYTSLWCVAYSRVEFFNMLYEIGFNKVVYGDTDSVKFIGEEGIEKIKRHNKEIDKEFEIINKKRNMIVNEKIGRWLDEGKVDCFKATGIKWYITSTNDKIEVKAAGAQMETLEKWLNEQKNPIASFSLKIKCFGLFKNVQLNYDNTVRIKYVNEIDKDTKKKILNKGTSLYYFNPYEEESK